MRNINTKMTICRSGSRLEYVPVYDDEACGDNYDKFLTVLEKKYKHIKYEITSEQSLADPYKDKSVQRALKHLSERLMAGSLVLVYYNGKLFTYKMKSAKKARDFERARFSNMQDDINGTSARYNAPADTKMKIANGRKRAENWTVYCNGGPRR